MGELGGQTPGPRRAACAGAADTGGAGGVPGRSQGRLWGQAPRQRAAGDLPLGLHLRRPRRVHRGDAPGAPQGPGPEPRHHHGPQVFAVHGDLPGHRGHRGEADRSGDGVRHPQVLQRGGCERRLREAEGPPHPDQHRGDQVPRRPPRRARQVDDGAEGPGERGQATPCQAGRGVGSESAGHGGAGQCGRLRRHQEQGVGRGHVEAVRTAHEPAVHAGLGPAEVPAGGADPCRLQAIEGHGGPGGGGGALPPSRRPAPRLARQAGRPRAPRGRPLQKQQPGAVATARGVAAGSAGRRGPQGRLRRLRAPRAFAVERCGVARALRVVREPRRGRGAAARQRRGREWSKDTAAQGRPAGVEPRRPAFRFRKERR
mmetsp:Transcript_25590/g.76311  ORF Transcript_25590/g.76311 Transcript_25590/m.76311 type:complete len:372 (-) Transcript_25590:897-2012(-)